MKPLLQTLATVDEVSAGAPGAEGIWETYLEWFRERALDTAEAKSPEELESFLLFHEDVYLDGSFILNRMYFLIPLSPRESRSGKLEWFAFSRLNYLERRWTPDHADEIERCLAVEYRRE